MTLRLARRLLLRFFALTLCLPLAALVQPQAWAQGSTPRAPEATFDDDSLLLTGDFNVALTPSMEDALARGVALYFVVDIDVARERVIINESVASRSETFRLSYVPLTRSWRLSTGLYTQNLPTLEAATRQFTRLRATKVMEKRLLQKGERYIVTARVRHDFNQLPKPIQLSALASREWQIDADPIRVVVAP
jgi:hypothetical protein